MPYSSNHHSRLRAGVSAIVVVLATLAAPAGAADLQAPAPMDAPAEPDAAPSDASAATQGTVAQGVQLPDVVVTAERRVGNLQRTAASISVRQGDDLVQQGKFTVESLLENVPGVSTIAPIGAATSGTDTPSSQFTIRGISSDSTSTGGVVATVPATAIYVDDIYSGIGGNYDLERLEVLRGPQGTLYGRSATSGVVALRTRGANLDKFDVYANAEAGNYDLRHYTLAVGGPIIQDKLGVRVAFNQFQRSGYDAKTASAINTTEGRIKVLLKPADGFSLELGAAFQDNRPRTGGVEVRLTTPDDYVRLPNTNIGGGKNTFEQYWVRGNADLGFAQLAYIGAFRGWKQDALNAQIGPGANFLDQQIELPKDHFWTHEVRLSSNAGSPIKWQVGLYRYDNDLTAINDIRYSQSGALLDRNETKRHTTDTGVFAEATVPITDALRLTGGIRYDRTRVASAQTDVLNVNLTANLNNGAIVGLPEVLVTTAVSGDAGVSVFNNTTFKARAEYDLTDRNLVYASVSSGFLPGDVQISSAVVTRFTAETLTAYEVGSKNRFFDNSLQLNFGAFYYDYSGYQARLNDNPSNPASAKYFNLPLNLWGAEFEAILAIDDNDRLSLNGILLRSKIHDAPADFARYSVKDSVWGFPEESLSGLYTHDFDLAGGSRLSASAEANYRGRYDVGSYSDTVASVGAGKFFSQEPIVLANGNLTWTSANNTFSLTGYVRNIFDERSKSNIIPQINGGVLPGPPGVPPVVVPFSLGSVSAVLAAPRTYGVVATVRF